MSGTTWIKHNFPPYVSGSEHYMPYTQGAPVVSFRLKRTEHGIIGTAETENGTVILYEDDHARI